MELTFTQKKSIRKNFGKLKETLSIPNLIEVQRHSYDQYLQMFVKPEERVMEGLQEVFVSIFPINDFHH